MDYTRKKNTDDFYQSKNLILEYDDEDDYCTQTVIGNYAGVQKYKDSYQSEEPIEYEYSSNTYDTHDKENIPNFNLYKHLYTKYRTCHVNMIYYPFSSSYVEDTYKTFYDDIIHSRKCPACNYYFDEKIYIIDNYILICNTCFSNEKCITYI